ncbi:hypothetical protein V2I01_18545 [Micromonospora sp. BRA006-A]|nr:hypothetical protein [Micromonospora sp. BRA006-A]
MDFDEVNRFLIEKVTAISVRYDAGEGTPCSGGGCATYRCGRDACTS